MLVAYKQLKDQELVLYFYNVITEESKLEATYLTLKRM